METIREDFFLETEAFTGVDRSLLTEETNLSTLSILSLFLINDYNYAKHKNLIVSKEGIKMDMTQQLDTIKVMLGKVDRSIRLDISQLFEGNEVVFYHDKLKSDAHYNFTRWTLDLIEDIEIAFEIESIYDKKNGYDKFLTLGDVLSSLENSLKSTM